MFKMIKLYPIVSMFFDNCVTISYTSIFLKGTFEDFRHFRSLLTAIKSFATIEQYLLTLITISEPILTLYRYFTSIPSVSKIISPLLNHFVIFYLSLNR